MNNIPTFNQLNTSVLNDLQAQLSVTINLFGKSVLRVLAIVQAGKIKLYYLVLGRLQKNIFADTADPESNGGTLERFGRVKLNRNPFPAQQAQYAIQLNGTAGSTVRASTTFKSDDDARSPGMLFILDNDFTLVTGNDTVVIRALTAGTISALNDLDTLTATSPIANVNSSVFVENSGTIIQPLDAETTEAYRAAVLRSYRLNPQGGSPPDYILWSQDAMGVAAVYPFASSGNNNEGDVYVESIIADSTDGKGTPSSAMLLDVASVIEQNPDLTLPVLERGRRPMTVFQINCLPVTPRNVDIVITGFQGLTPAIQTLITNAITNAINKVRPFVAGADVLSNKNDVLSINSIVGFIITAQPGSIWTSIDLSIDGNPVSTFNFLLGNIPYVNSITFV